MSPWRLRWFDLTRGTPTAVGALRRQIGWFKTLRVLSRFVWRKLWRRPFKGLKRSGPLTDAERFTRHQLLPVVLLDDILQVNMGFAPDRAHSILAEVVGSSGASFIGYATGIKSAETWAGQSPEERLKTARGSVAKFLNAEVEEVSEPGVSFGFNVTRCHFVSLCNELERPQLAALFCRADEVLFGDPAYEVHLDRAETLASGAPACTFRFRWGNVTPSSIQDEDSKEA